MWAKLSVQWKHRVSDVQGRWRRSNLNSMLDQRETLSGPTAPTLPRAVFPGWRSIHPSGLRTADPLPHQFLAASRWPMPYGQAVPFEQRFWSRWHWHLDIHGPWPSISGASRRVVLGLAFALADGLSVSMSMDDRIRTERHLNPWRHSCVSAEELEVQTAMKRELHHVLPQP